MKTARGIELDLKESDYSFNFLDLLFFFSSEFYRDKFATELSKTIKEETFKLENKYKNKIMCERLIAIFLYKRIEKRGYRILDLNKKEIPEEVWFDIRMIY